MEEYDGMDFDWEGLWQSLNNNGWRGDVKKIVMNKVMEIVDMLEDLDRLKMGMIDDEDFIEKWGDKFVRR